MRHSNFRAAAIARVALLAAAAVLAGCGQAPPPHALPSDPPPDPADARAPVPPPPPAPLPAGTATGVAGARLQVAPGHVSHCAGGDRATAEVSWEAPGKTSVRIEVGQAGDPATARNVFAAGGQTGSSTTGEWVVDGLAFHLVDAASGSELASYRVTTLPCGR